jgi:hypothetical protein
MLHCVENRRMEFLRTTWAESLAQTMESELAQAAARAKRDLSIKHHEILLEQVGRR